MVAKSIAKMYTNIHKPTDYNAYMYVQSTAFEHDNICQTN